MFKSKNFPIAEDQPRTIFLVSREARNCGRSDRKRKIVKAFAPYRNPSAKPRDFCMAGAEGLEPSTYGFGDRRSTN